MATARPVRTMDPYAEQFWAFTLNKELRLQRVPSAGSSAGRRGRPATAACPTISRGPRPSVWRRCSPGQCGGFPDARTTWPLDKQALIDSARKTSRAIVVDEGYERYGVTAEIAAAIADGAFYHLDAPVKRIGAMDVPVPFSPVLEDLTVPSEKTIFEVAKTLGRK